jgi:hypothetical protein
MMAAPAASSASIEMTTALVKKKEIVTTLNAL